MFSTSGHNIRADHQLGQNKENINQVYVYLNELCDLPFKCLQVNLILFLSVRSSSPSLVLLIVQLSLYFLLNMTKETEVQLKGHSVRIF